jgi:hypothetical protein
MFILPASSKNSAKILGQNHLAETKISMFWLSLIQFLFPYWAPAEFQGT